jgi:electron transport complex protein RnfA
MSYAGIAFVFVFIDNAALHALFGLGEAADPKGSRWPESLAIFALATSIGLLGGLASWALSLIGLEFASSWIMLALAFLLFLGLKAAARKIFPGTSAKLNESLMRIESSGIVYAIGIIVSGARLDPLRSVAAGLAAALGHFAAVFALRRVMKRLSLEPVPEAFKGIPILLLSAGLMALAFSAFDRGLLGGILP